MLDAYRELQELNALRYFLPFQLWQPPELESPPYDYPGRQWAWWIHKLASRYGWARKDIFELWPEEAAAYLQEILVTEFEEADDRRALSELGYHYDKTTGKASFRPLPRPGWMVKDNPQPTVRIRREMLPVGNVIDLSQVAS